MLIKQPKKTLGDAERPQSLQTIGDRLRGKRSS